ncbi:uncharacterized protein LOC116573399 isoform X2 [Mustela erminea]|uniref:uncharacterized protein LOC116573399 isoform X2 n=1 Tax=Mustela erminea TaxID=36723 RepID=UPI0013870896|nr:uncharacterized protein LOC116573399 isoform X2 [Mustela erminea]
MGTLRLDTGVAPGLLRMCAAPLPSSSRRRPRPREKTVPDASAVRARPQVVSEQPVSPGGLGVGDPLNGRFPAERRLTEEEALVLELGILSGRLTTAQPAPSLCPGLIESEMELQESCTLMVIHTLQGQQKMITSQGIPSLKQKVILKLEQGEEPWILEEEFLSQNDQMPGHGTCPRAGLGVWLHWFPLLRQCCIRSLSLPGPDSNSVHEGFYT